MVFITSGGSDTKIVNDGTMGALDGFSLFISGLIVFKFIFALIYTLKWNFRTWFSQYYRKSKIDVNEEFKRIRKDRNGAISSDEDEVDDDGSKKTADVDPMKSYNVFDQDVEGNPVMKVTQNAAEIDDSDNDDEEFEDAHEEEEADKELEDDWRQKSVQYRYS
jgi:DNA-directed RNA polymerase delta subunit